MNVSVGLNSHAWLVGSRALEQWFPFWLHNRIAGQIFKLIISTSHLQTLVYCSGIRCRPRCLLKLPQGFFSVAWNEGPWVNRRRRGKRTQEVSVGSLSKQLPYLDRLPLLWATPCLSKGISAGWFVPISNVWLQCQVFPTLSSLPLPGFGWARMGSFCTISSHTNSWTLPSGNRCSPLRRGPSR
jgi:hypothetical protein